MSRSAALGTTKRLNVALKGPNKVVASPMARLFGPFRAIGARFGLFPGRRCALPWAEMFKPVGLKKIEMTSAVGLCFFEPKSHLEY